MSKRSHVFISHHHNDDVHVDKFTNLLNKRGYDVRNSSVRMKPANQRRMEQGRVKDATIKRLLRMKVNWASKVIVLIGPKTHTRPWVDWEIKQANRLGKRIVGVYLHGGSKNDVPKSLDDYAHAIVKWNPDSIIDAIEGKNNRFENPEGELREPVHMGSNSQC